MSNNQEKLESLVQPTGLLNYEQVRRYLVENKQIHKPGKGMKYLLKTITQSDDVQSMIKDLENIASHLKSKQNSPRKRGPKPKHKMKKGSEENDIDKYVPEELNRRLNEQLAFYGKSQTRNFLHRVSKLIDALDEELAE